MCGRMCVCTGDQVRLMRVRRQVLDGRQATTVQMTGPGMRMAIPDDDEEDSMYVCTMSGYVRLTVSRQVREATMRMCGMGWTTTGTVR